MTNKMTKIPSDSKRAIVSLLFWFAFLPFCVSEIWDIWAGYESLFNLKIGDTMSMVFSIMIAFIAYGKWVMDINKLKEEVNNG